MANRLQLPFADVGSGITPEDGAKLFFFDTGTSNPRATYSDQAATTPNANPVLSDQNGVFSDIFLDGSYKVRLTDKNDVQIWEADPVFDIISATTVDNIAALKALTGVADNEILDTVGYTVDGVGGASYFFHSSSTATANDGTIILPDSGSGRYLARFLERIPVGLFGAVGDGDGAGDGTDDSVALQKVLTFMVANKGAIEFDGTKTYRADTPLTAELTGADQQARWAIFGNTSTIDCSNQTGSNIGLTIGDSSLTNFNEKGFYHISKLRILGPEAAVPINEATNATTFVGLFVVNSIRVLLEEVECTRCYTGIKTAVVFPLTTINCNVENNFIGLHSDDVSNINNHYELSAKQCWYSVLIIKSGNFSSAKISGITFHDLWTEGSRVGVHVDSGSLAANRVRSIRFVGGFYKTVLYDNFRFGLQFNFATPQTRSADSTGKIFNVISEGGNMPGVAATATAGVFVFPTTTGVFGFTGHGPIDDTDANVIVNNPSWGDYEITGKESAETISGFKRLLWKNNTRYRNAEVPWDSSTSQVPVYIPAPDEASPGPYPGTWTVNITFDTPGDLVVVLSTQVGQYTKIGRMVFLNFSVVTSTFTHTTASGNLRITGIPHQPRTLTGYAPVGQISYSGITKATYTDIALSAFSASSIMNIAAAGSGVSRSTVKAADMPTGGSVILHGTLCYETDE